jgi:hypothetical protein
MRDRGQRGREADAVGRVFAAAARAGQKHAFARRVYILHTRRRADVLDGADVAAWLKAYRGALIIGEETSGGSAATAAGLRPNWCCRISQIKVVIPLMQF